MKAFRKNGLKLFLASASGRVSKIFAVVVLAFPALAPSPVFACAACYGKSDSVLASGMNWGILTLLGVVLTVLSCIAVFFVHIVRKEETLSQTPPDNRSDDL